jgi:hypothetical protein
MIDGRSYILFRVLLPAIVPMHKEYVRLNYLNFELGQNKTTLFLIN